VNVLGELRELSKQVKDLTVTPTECARRLEEIGDE